MTIAIIDHLISEHLKTPGTGLRLSVFAARTGLDSQKIIKHITTHHPELELIDADGTLMIQHTIP